MHPFIEHMQKLAEAAPPSWPQSKHAARLLPLRQMQLPKAGTFHVGPAHVQEVAPRKRRSSFTNVLLYCTIRAQTTPGPCLPLPRAITSPPPRENSHPSILEKGGIIPKLTFATLLVGCPGAELALARLLVGVLIMQVGPVLCGLLLLPVTTERDG